MNLTTLLGLGKPLVGENYDIAVPNNNMDLIDAAVAADRASIASLDTDLSKPHHAVLIASAGQSIPNTTATKVQFPAVPHSIFGCTYSDANDEITIVRAGLYQINASVGYTANATSVRYASIQQNATTICVGGATGATGGFQTAAVSILHKLAVNDVISLETTQFSGGALSTSASSDRTQLSLYWVSDLP
jgi:hypothetical protein